jgi:hypothetical protein
VGVLVLVPVLVSVNVAVGGAAVSVGLGSVGVVDDLSVAATVALGMESTTNGAMFVGELVLHPVKTNMKNKPM